MINNVELDISDFLAQHIWQCKTCEP